MDIMLLAFLLAVLFGVVAFGLSFVSDRSYNTVAWATGVGIGSFLINWIVNSCLFYFGQVVMAGPGVWWVIVLNAFVVAVFSGIAYLNTDDVDASLIVSVAMAVVLGLGALIHNILPIGAEGAKEHLAQLKVELITAEQQNAAKHTAAKSEKKAANVKSDNIYPVTSNENMVELSCYSAWAKAKAAMRDFGDRYKLGDCEPLIIKGRRYYAFDMRVEDAFSITGTSTKAVGGVVTAYILVDAVDAGADPILKKNLKIKYWIGGRHSASVSRLVYMHYKGRYYTDDLSFEVDDSYTPYYTATIGRPFVQFDRAAPEKFITVNALTGKISEYDVNKPDSVPAWVDRVNSEATVRARLEKWGQWYKAPYDNTWQSGVDRLKVSGPLNFVFTDEGPAWQALMTSLNSDTAVKYVAYASTRSNRVRMFSAPSGLRTEEVVTAAIGNVPLGTSKYDVADLSLHMVNGQWTWAGSLIKAGSREAVELNGIDSGANVDYSGFALANATKTGATAISMGHSKSDAYDDYYAANSDDHDSEELSSGSNVNTVAGEISYISRPQVFNGQTYFIFTIKGNEDRLYQCFVKPADVGMLALDKTKVGDRVAVGYNDDNGSIIMVKSFNNLTRGFKVVTVTSTTSVAPTIVPSTTAS